MRSRPIDQVKDKLIGVRYYRAQAGGKGILGHELLQHVPRGPPHGPGDRHDFILANQAGHQGGRPRAQKAGEAGNLGQYLEKGGGFSRGASEASLGG